MSLPRSNWKMLVPYMVPLASSSRVDGLLDSIFTAFQATSYMDGTARTTGSGVAWTFLRTSSFDASPTARGVTAVVYGYPPTMSVISQSVIFAGTGSALSSSLNPAIGTHYYDRGPAPFTASVLYMALQKQANWSQYNNWLSPIGAIFNSGSSGTNINKSGSGLINLFIPNSVAIGGAGGNIYNANSIEKIYIWECGEAVSIALFSSSSITSSQQGNLMTTVNTTSGSIYAGIAGAYIDPESTNTTVDAEVDGKLYGIAATGVPIGGGSRAAYALAPSSVNYEMVWMSAGSSTGGIHADFLSHGVGYGQLNPNLNKALYYVPGTDQKRYMTLLNSNTMGLPSYTPKGFLTSNPLYYFDGTSIGIGNPGGNGKFLGRLREIEAIKGAPSGMTYRSGSVDYGYTLGGSTNFATQAILFRTGV
jgi:hypothetical protein